MWRRENLRKNFLRVKQIADQNLGRAEKSEVLTEDQQGNEKRVELVRQVSHNLIKKVTALLEAQPGSDIEKRLKKLPETGLSHTLIESAGLLGEETLLGLVCQMCGECQSVLAKEELQCELDIEREVLQPLQQIAEVDIPSILKHRKQLNKSTLDMDSAKNRFNSAVRQSHVPGANMASAAAKADAVREEYEEAQNKVETIKDNLSVELCNFIAKESEHSSRLVALLEAQASYHKKALQAIEEMIPKMKNEIDAYPIKPIFGMALEEHLRIMGRDISLVMEACILTLLDTAMEEEGLFRIAGGALKVKKLRACLDAHIIDMEEFSTDPHTVAGVLKQYLRELPEPLLTFGLYSEFMQTTTLPHEQRLQALHAAVNKLPPANYNNLRYLIKFLALLAERSNKNKMTPGNIGIVIGPNLLWSRGETTPNMLTAGAVSAIIEAFVIHADRFFPGEMDISMSGSYIQESPSHDHADHTLAAPAAAPPAGSCPVLGSSASPTILVSGVAQGAHPVTNSLSPTLGDSPEGHHSSHGTIHRRQTKKPAPPPPPERPYSVAVTAQARGTDGASSSQTWPHTVPPPSPDSPQADAGAAVVDGDRHRHSPPERRISGHERPHGPPPERPSAPPPERPKLPPAPQPQAGSQQPGAAQGGHQRSASTGAMYINTGTTSTTSGSSSSHESLQAGNGSSLTAPGQGYGMPVGTSTLGRHSSMRPTRPNPPPPPPPINQKSEHTHL